MFFKSLFEDLSVYLSCILDSSITDDTLVLSVCTGAKCKSLKSNWFSRVECGLLDHGLSSVECGPWVIKCGMWTCGPRVI